MKVIANLVFLIFALMFSSLYLLWEYQKEIIDEVGAWAVSSYKNQFHSEWKESLRDLGAGQTQPAIALLEGKKWGEIRNRDRVYPMKRKLLETLAAKLHINERYEELLHWAEIWRELDERDVTAMAYWYEALRHTSDRREEGIRGLEETWQRFPSNETLTKFLAATLVDLHTYRKNWRYGTGGTIFLAKSMVSGSTNPVSAKKESSIHLFDSYFDRPLSGKRIRATAVDGESRTLAKRATVLPADDTITPAISQALQNLPDEMLVQVAADRRQALCDG